MEAPDVDEAKPGTAGVGGHGGDQVVRVAQLSPVLVEEAVLAIVGGGPIVESGDVSSVYTPSTDVVDMAVPFLVVAGSTACVSDSHARCDVVDGDDHIGGTSRRVRRWR